MKDAVIEHVLLKGNNSTLKRIFIPRRNKNKHIPIEVTPKLLNISKWDIQAPNFPNQFSGAGIAELKI
jgi:hypothetical protein